MEMDSGACPDARLQELIDQVGRGEPSSLAHIDDLISRHGNDARLHFLKGSVLAGRGEIAEGLMAMTRAVEIAPGYTIARFQLGFLHLTSGHPATAEQVWEPLAELPEDHWLALFVTGLKALIRDDFDACIAALSAGIARNRELIPMNNDMQLIIDQVRQQDLSGNGTDDGSVSATHMFLQQFSTTRH